MVGERAKFVSASHVEDLVALTLTRPAAAFHEAAVASRLNILVAGGTQGREDDAAQLPRRRGPTSRAGRHRGGGVRAQGAASRRRRDAVPAAQPRGDRRDQAAATGQGGTADAAVAHRRRRGPSGGVAGPPLALTSDMGERMAFVAAQTGHAWWRLEWCQRGGHSNRPRAFGKVQLRPRSPVAGGSRL